MCVCVCVLCVCVCGWVCVGVCGCVHMHITYILTTVHTCTYVYQCTENMPRLQPRYYSAASSPLEDRLRFKVVFNLTVLPNRELNQERR